MNHNDFYTNAVELLASISTDSLTLAMNFVEKFGLDAAASCKTLATIIKHMECVEDHLFIVMGLLRELDQLERRSDEIRRRLIEQAKLN